MLKDIKLMIEFIKNISTTIYGKEVFFYDYEENRWYSREHCRYVEFEEILKWLEEQIYPAISEPVEYICSECCECRRYINDLCSGEISTCADYES